MTCTCVGQLEKYESDNRLYDFPFDRYREIQAGGVIASVAAIVIDPDDLTLTVGSPTHSTDTAQVRIAGGTSGVTYSLTCVATVGSSQLTGVGELVVL